MFTKFFKNFGIDDRTGIPSFTKKNAILLLGLFIIWITYLIVFLTLSLFKQVGIDGGATDIINTVTMALCSMLTAAWTAYQANRTFKMKFGDAELITKRNKEESWEKKLNLRNKKSKASDDEDEDDEDFTPSHSFR